METALLFFPSPQIQIIGRDVTGKVPQLRIVETHYLVVEQDDHRNILHGQRIGLAV